VALANLLAEIELQGGYEGVGPEPVVSLEQFFDGNIDLGSIGGNLGDHPGMDTFFRVLREIRDRPDVYDVLVGITEVEDDELSWPYSDHVYVITTATVDAVANWAKPLEADQPGEGWWNGAPPRWPIQVPEDAHIVTLWWD
jgi:hypothetical protein